jgi:hypothetical protein
MTPVSTGSGHGKDSRTQTRTTFKLIEGVGNRGNRVLDTFLMGLLTGAKRWVANAQRGTAADRGGRPPLGIYLGPALSTLPSPRPTARPINVGEITV